MIREINIQDREDIDRMQFELQKYFSEIDRTKESLLHKRSRNGDDNISKETKRYEFI